MIDTKELNIKKKYRSFTVFHATGCFNHNSASRKTHAGPTGKDGLFELRSKGQVQFYRKLQDSSYKPLKLRTPPPLLSKQVQY